MDSEAEMQPGGEFLTSGRIVPVRREGNKVFIRTLRQDEEDTGEAVNRRAGDHVIFEPGRLQSTPGSTRTTLRHCHPPTL